MRLASDDIVLRPLTAHDAAPLRALVDADAWRGMSAPFPRTDEAMAGHLSGLIERPGTIAFAVLYRDEIVGRTAFYDLVPGLRVEIGNTIYARRVWGTVVNPAVKLLMFTHAFDELAVGRVALRCDHRNRRSAAAIARLGATFEGTLRHFRPAADGTVADIDYFSVLRTEWPRVRTGLEHRIAEGRIAASRTSAQA